MWFINTRPQDRADRLTRSLTEAGIEVKNLPLLELIACPWSPVLAALYAELEQADMIVVVSPTAVHIGMQYLEQAGIHLAQLPHVQWVAVGKTTAQVLEDYGIHSHVPELESSEGMLSLALFQSITPKKVAFWRGEGGRQFMMQHLQQRGVEILNFILYQRRCPPSSVAIWRECLFLLRQQHMPVCVLVTSEASWLNWLSLVQSDQLNLADFHFLVLGQRLFDLLTQHDPSHRLSVSQLTDLQPETILQQIAVWQGET